jgi:hypothetical protein
MLRLYRHLLVDYQPDVRPARMHNLPLNVTFSFSLTQIIDVVWVHNWVGIYQYPIVVAID